jgi:hypothetical protein
MAKKKILAHVTIPVTTSVMTSVEMEIDDDLPTKEINDAILEHALNNVPPFRLVVEQAEDGPHVELGEEVGTHRYLNRGNVAFAVCNEASVDEVESMDEDGDEG